MKVPPHTQASLNRYVLHGVPTGDFLRAVLSNDLFESFARADSENSANMFEIANFIYNHVPRCCYGDSERVTEWLRLHKEEPEKTHQAVALYQSKLDGLGY